MCEISHCTSNSGDEMTQKVENTSQQKLSVCEQAAPRKVLKHPLEIQSSTSSHDVTLPPFKKNRGFQIILNAASKLN